jgi:Tfp pilus assembly protein PilX
VIPRITAATRKLRRRVDLRREDGVALVLALSFSIVLALVGTTTVVYTTENQRSSHHSKATKTTQALAEAGLHYAYSTLYNSPTPTMPGAVPSRTVSVNGGTVTYSGVLNGNTWTLSGAAHLPNPTGASEIVRAVRGKVSVGSSQQGSSNNAVWNYVYADSLATCTTLGNSVNVNVPMYVRGNLCLQNSASFTGTVLQVGGTVQLENSSTIGFSGANVDEVHIGGGCRLETSGPFTNPCGPAQKVYGDVVDASPTGLTKPPVDLAGWYQNSQPGPLHGCTSGSFPGGFDNDTTLNRSRGTVNLLPSTAYDCTVTSGSQVVGRIAWNPSTKALTIAGTIFFDGDIEFTNSAQAFYSGRATIYTSGKITMRNSTQLCGAASCHSDWNATQNLLAFVAGSSTDAVGIDMENSTVFQGALYAVNDYSEGNSATVWGPIIARQLHFQNSVTNHYVPLGTLLPGMPATYEEVIALVNEPGSWE